jgi:hypothetical protein
MYSGKIAVPPGGGGIRKNNEVFFELFHLMCQLFKSDKE